MRKPTTMSKLSFRELTEKKERFFFSCRLIISTKMQKVLAEIGEFGTAQLLLYVLISIVSFMGGAQTLLLAWTAYAAETRYHLIWV